MTKLSLLSAAAVMAVVLPTASFAEDHGVARGGGAPGAHFSGGGAAFHSGGGGAPVAQFSGVRPGGSAPVARFNSPAAGFRSAGVSSAPATTQFNSGGYGGGYYRHRDRGFFPGAVAGAVVGGALAADSYAYYGEPGYYAPGYYDDQYYDDSAVVTAAPAPAGDDAVAYCMQTYHSYDPASGTYLGFDGLRHPCP